MEQFYSELNKDMSDIEYRTLQREGICNCCTRIIPKGEMKVIVFRNWKNGAYNIMLCPECINTMSDIIKENNNERKQNSI